MLKELFEREEKNLGYFFKHLNLESVEKVFDLMFQCQGLIITTGVGKSGLVAEKFALTLTSTGSRAFFLSPSNALHGDIGMVSENDVFLMFSKSGESDELLHIIPFLRNRGVKIVAVVNKPSSRLAKACDMSIFLPMEKELCPFDLVPTTSTVTQMVLGDVLAVALMMQKNFTLTQYAKNHPSGKIGRTLTLRVSDLMLRGDAVPLCKPEDKLVDILVQLSDKRCGCVLIVDSEQKMDGIFTDGDLRRSLQKFGPKALEMSMRSLMTKTARLIQQDAMAKQALEMMEADQQHPITVLPVIDEKQRIIGLIKMHDIVQSGL